MRFIVDAQLPRRLARWLNARGHDVLHTLDLPEQALFISPSKSESGAW
ncbi:DUF5615 family PIN-like protein [Thiocapsa sp.]|nr:DUF5615 family PIN-like protein [Thiocapsa sp.]